MSIKISNLTSASSVDGTELAPIVQSSTTKRTTLQIIADWVVKTSTSFLQSGTGAVARTMQAKARGVQVSLEDFGGGTSKTNTQNDTALAAAIAALSASGVLVLEGLGTYEISAQILIDTLDAITIRGQGKNKTIINWTGAAAASSAAIKIRRSSYCVIEDLDVRCTGVNKPAYGIWLTSNGSGVTQFNTIKNCTVGGAPTYGFSSDGVKIGDANLDTNVDGNKLEDVEISGCVATSVRIDGANTNMTQILRGAIAANTGNAGASIRMGNFCRGVYIDGVLFTDTETSTSSGLIYIEKEFSGLVSINNIVVELYRHPFLYGELDTAGQIASGQVAFKNFISTCNFVSVGSAETNIINFLQHGLLSLENCYIAGRTDGSATYITHNTPNNAGPGLRTLATKNVHLYYSGMAFSFTATQTVPSRWIGDYATASGVSANSSLVSWQLATLLDISQAGAGQIKYPATQNASADPNTQDDYEEGTWTASMAPLTSGSITINASVKTGTYTKVGRQVSISGLLSVTSVSAPVGRLRISGLPFSAGSGNQFECPVLIVTDTLTLNIALVGWINNAQAFIDVYRLTTPTVDDAAAVVQAGSNFRLNATYFTT